eukprot:3109326-Amphidinium_carterae.1
MSPSWTHYAPQTSAMAAAEREPPQAPISNVNYSLAHSTSQLRFVHDVIQAASLKLSYGKEESK